MKLSYACAIFACVTATVARNVPDAPNGPLLKRQGSSDSPGILYSCVSECIEDETPCSPTDGSCLCPYLSSFSDQFLANLCADDYCTSISSMPLIDATSISTFCATAFPAEITSALGEESFISEIPITSFSPSNTVTSTTTSASSESSTNIARETEPPSSDETNGGGLSTGAQAGIGVGVSLGVILLVVAGYFLGRRSRRNRESTVPEPMVVAGQGDTDSGGAAKGPMKLESTEGRMELESVNPPTHYEMYAPMPTPMEPQAELSANPSRHA
ncbi:hypothetical protein F5X68DRAFT_264444 [Plectosphaerella plurivora]|uniref:Extracellular membrane protein CFEM domain-containing protein n=1 Tax=Plectosphaerella plurivora TaxID=936078 RepID=A0A9P8V2M4_9PEZI|nr:hypothetical protein F5X68DRAFT_264444 [Plectosphaerella plurivora]